MYSALSTFSIMGFASTVHSGIYVLVLMLSVKSGSSAPHDWKCDRNIMWQVDKINVILKETAQLRTFQMSKNAIPTENECKESRCDVLKQLKDYNSCGVTFLSTDDNNQTVIKKEMHGLITNLQMPRHSKEEKCSLPDPSCPTEIKQLSLWNKIRLLQVIMTCLQTQDICPS
ncbi:hypothetical protein IRJ41_009759 [Triplophysa rosa]|uniref:Uncharacterized protein n=1 Tax=Triplophysa rosa TaxID=992332 RepID=A0A9W8C982_TRIRA|nr:hypothetical protein IRJ41_009759 [Triplophysa rosa]